MENFELIIGVNPWTAIAVLLNTLTIFFVGRKFLFKPVMNMIESRQQEIDGMYADANAAKADAKAMQAEYQAKLENAQAASERIVKEATARGQAREDAIIRQANAEASAIMEKASADIAQEKKKALNDAKDEISDIAMAIAGKVVGRELDAAHRDKLVDEFIDALGDGL